MTRSTAAALLSIGLGAPAWAGQVRVRPEAVVTQETVRLGDVAELQGFDFDAYARMAAIPVTRAPGEGLAASVPVSEIRNALRSAGVNLAEIELLGYSRCRVSRPGSVRDPGERPAARIVASTPRGETPKPTAVVNTTVTPSVTHETLETKLRAFLASYLQIPGAKLEVRFNPSSRDNLGLDAATHHFEIRRRSDARLGLISLEVDITPLNGEPRTVPIVAEAAAVKDVLVARRTINRGELVESGRLKLEPRRFVDVAAIGVSDPTTIVGQKARRLIPAGEMLTTSSVEPTPIVRRGEAVTIWMRQGGLLIKAGGRAQGDGSLGDRIDVARDGSRRKQDLIEAVVTGPGTVALGATSPVALATER